MFKVVQSWWPWLVSRQRDEAEIDGSASQLNATECRRNWVTVSRPRMVVTQPVGLVEGRGRRLYCNMDIPATT